MQLAFDQSLAQGYRSETQRIRVMSEAWLTRYMYCVHCGGSLAPFANNTPVGDVYCVQCASEYELKSSTRPLRQRIMDGAWGAMLAKIERGTVPNFFCLHYDRNAYTVISLTVIPRHFFTKEVIAKRRPLAANARRHGWVGCDIIVSAIPDSGKIAVIDACTAKRKTAVLSQYHALAFLHGVPLPSKGWLLDVIRILDAMPAREFSLADVYAQEAALARLHPGNRNIRAKLRQQLQVLRDNGYLAFLGNGRYRKLLP